MTQKKIDNNSNELDVNYTIPLPPEIIYEIFSYLDENSQSNLALTQRMFGRSVFQKDRVARVTKKLFALAGSAEQDKMEEILKKWPEFLSVYAPLKDISGRVFKNVTLFQHALWTGDVRYMANMMLDCLQNQEEGESIRQELLHQYQELMEKGLSYELNGQSYQEKQFSLQPLIDALTTYVKNFSNLTYEERCSNWCTQVGLNQIRLPAHIRHHYCDSEESFWDTTFCNEKFTRSLKLYNYIKSSEELWNESLVGLGVKFAIKGQAAVGARGVNCARLDLKAIEALCKVRTEDLRLFIQRLQTPIQNLEKDQEQELRYTGS